MSLSKQERENDKVLALGLMLERLGDGRISMQFFDPSAPPLGGIRKTTWLELEQAHYVIPQFNQQRYILTGTGWIKALRLAGRTKDTVFLLAKHSKKFRLTDALSIGVDSMQRNFAPMVQAVDLWRGSQITDVTAKLIIYRAFVESELEIPKHLAGPVHRSYFTPEHADFEPRTMWSLSNAFTSALKSLDPIPQFKATAKLGSFLQGVVA